MAFAEPYDQWSVSTAFCRFGCYRFNQMEARFMESLRGDPERGDLDTPHLHHETREEQRELQKWRTEAVADCIRELGYRVECGYYRCITWEDANAEGDPRHGGAYRGSNYIILNIIDCDGNYVYGNGHNRRTDESSYTQDLEERDLCGHRTVFEIAVNHANSLRRMAGIYHVCDLEDPVAVAVQANNENSPEPVGNVVLVERDAELRRLVRSVEPELQLDVIQDYCRQGARCNKWEGEQDWIEGVSTIGNTLPNDIVEALAEFRHQDRNFFRDADYEFWIPEEMIELPTACPWEDSLAISPTVTTPEVTVGRFLQ
jgi:hypothetical protein